MQAQPRRTLVIIDQLPFYREGLHRLLFESGFQAIWNDDSLPPDLAATSVNQAPDLMVTGSDLATARQEIATMRRCFPSCRIILLLDSNQSELLDGVLDCGADSIVPKESSCKVLLETVRLVFDGVNVMPSKVFDALRNPTETFPPQQSPDDAIAGNSKGPGGEQGPVLASPQTPPPTMASRAPAMIGLSHIPVTPAVAPRAHGLSARELNVLLGLKEGLPNKQIARQLDITEATVKVHVKSILRKVGVRNRTQVAMWASHQPTTVVPNHGPEVNGMTAPVMAFRHNLGAWPPASLGS